jgi:hypothetical protein
MLLEGSTVEAFSNKIVPGVYSPRPPSRSTRRSLTEIHDTRDLNENHDRSRRRALVFLPGFLFTGCVAAESAKAVVVDSSSNPKVFTAGEAMGVEGAKERFMLAQKTLNDLSDNYDEICKGGGDNVRRYLGTVGTTSALYGIGKIMKELQEEASDIVEYTETMSEFSYSLSAADTSAYSANFVEHSSAKTKPAKLFEDARLDIERMQEYMSVMANELNLK